MAYGTQWLQQNKYLGLIVPSAVLPLENNIMLNPSHPAIKQVRADQQFDFMYDDRMFAAKGLANPRLRDLAPCPMTYNGLAFSYEKTMPPFDCPAECGYIGRAQV